MTVWRSDSYQEDVARVANMAIDWTQFQAATVLLSGASGMIGSFLVDVLMVRNRDHATNCTVKAVARNAAAMRQRFAHWAGDEHLKLIPADVCSGGLRGESADFVIHAAGNTHPVAYATDPVGTIMTNVQGTYAMLDLAVAARARRFVFVSTVEIYGENSAGERPFREDDMGYIDCNTLRAGYPESKRAGEALCQAFATSGGLQVVIPRLPRVFGPTVRPDDTKAISQFLQRAVDGCDIVLKSDGTQLYSYCYVADAVSAILTCLTAGQPGQAYNVAHPSCDVRLRDLAGRVARAAGTNVVFDVPGEVERRGYSAATVAVMDGTKIAGLGWVPQWDIDAGIAHTVAALKCV